MKIQFCDLCNESVPQSDIDAARARVVKGRVVCASCERAMSLAGPSAGAQAAPAPEAPLGAANVPLAPAPSSPVTPGPAPATVLASRPSSPGLWVAVIGLLATAGVVFVFQKRIDELAGSGQTMAQRLGEDQQQIARLEAKLKASIADEVGMEKRWQAQFSEQSQRFQDLSASLAQSSAATDRAREDLKQALALLREDLHKGTLTGEQRLDEISHRLAQSEDAQRELREKLSDFQKAAEDARKAAEVAAKSQPAPAAPAGPAWQAALVGLASDNPSIRWEAVDELGRSKDAAVIPHVTPMLRDADLFVRMCAARVLGDLGTLQGVAALIDSLEDSEATVRESAWNALRTLTGKDFKFDPQASETERQKRVKQWREWWKKEGEPLLEGGAGAPEGKTTPPELKSGTQKS